MKQKKIKIWTSQLDKTMIGKKKFELAKQNWIDDTWFMTSSDLRHNNNTHFKSLDLGANVFQNKQTLKGILIQNSTAKNEK